MIGVMLNLVPKPFFRENKLLLEPWSSQSPFFSFPFFRKSLYPSIRSSVISPSFDVDAIINHINQQHDYSSKCANVCSMSQSYW